MSANILEGYSSNEKTAYITAIASIATADMSASQQEINYIGNLADAAGLSGSEKQTVLNAATDASGAPLKTALDSLQSSELKYSLITDLMAFAESDNNISEQEKQHIASIASYLGINGEQLQALSEYVKETAGQPAEAMGIGGLSGAGGAGGILDQLGLGQKLQNSGINMGSLTKGLIAFVGPMILGNMLNKNMQGSGNSGMGQGGGLGSLIGSLSGGKGLSGLGGLLSGFLK